MTWKITARTWTPSQISTARWLDAADVPTTPNIAVIRAETTDGILELTELT